MKKTKTLGLFRGLFWQVVGTAFGLGFVTVIRVLMGLPAWKAEPAVVVGALFGALFFLYGVGVLDDWLKWAAGEETPRAGRIRSGLAQLLGSFPGSQGHRYPVSDPFAHPFRGGRSYSP